MKMVDGKPVYSKTEQLISIPLMGISAVLFYLAFKGDKVEKADEKAFKACQAQMTVIAHPNYAIVPRTDGVQSGGEYYFAWPTGSGLSVAGSGSASCLVNAATLEISSLTLSGKERIWRQPDR